MPIRMKSPDGSILVFPDGTSRQEMMDAMSHHRRSSQSHPPVGPKIMQRASGPGSAQANGLRGPVRSTDGDDFEVRLRPSQQADDLPAPMRPPQRADGPSATWMRGSQYADDVDLAPLRPSQNTDDWAAASMRGPQHADDWEPPMRGPQRDLAWPREMRGSIRAEPWLDPEALALADARENLQDKDRRTYRLFFNGYVPEETGRLYTDDTAALFQGLTWNASDELSAMWRAWQAAKAVSDGEELGYTPMQAYAASLAADRERKEFYSGQHPYRSAAFGLFGETFSPLNRIGRGTSGARWRRAVRRYAKPVFENAVQGAFEAEPGQRLAGAAKGAAGATVSSIGTAAFDYARPTALETLDPGGHLRSAIEQLRMRYPALMRYAEKAADIAAETSNEAIVDKILDASGATDALGRLRLNPEEEPTPRHRETR